MTWSIKLCIFLLITVVMLTIVCCDLIQLILVLVSHACLQVIWNRIHCLAGLCNLLDNHLICFGPCLLGRHLLDLAFQSDARLHVWRDPLMMATSRWCRSSFYALVAILRLRRPFNVELMVEVGIRRRVIKLLDCGSDFSMLSRYLYSGRCPWLIAFMSAYLKPLR